ncbi:methylated-DNA--[protein]-cysteine S-methyltransferase [Streptomyces clavuligerus]|nr:methylated-DNA-protein-cysteine S-methyltransferase [Streptomyces clavuligerus]MBY6303164.1 methylated-DNA--[protein]-cysteine S-methyltransferase [Streptomyces clavuligerus]QPL66529.1 methylated-DNA--[protein]-cysteine S-methyltransferase [Streptomyces clavuligerus]QPL72564.1 methylated-DNA--[protein]-cysteine S-methyltransferase [Streptomyces clavuligerus]QPL78639.1 methylated-DNA--[protein]-cysteine S-methyltransferase [Streptomyces clavuligerus]
MTLYTTTESPLGTVLLVGVESATAPGGTALVSLSVPGQKGAAVVRPDWRHGPGAFAEIEAQLRAYFAGTRTRFAIEWAEVAPGAAAPTAFQRRVWRALEEIPYGTTTTYGEIARRVGVSGAAVRAVGTAIGRNPLLVVRPCHRVIGADGALRGYAGGLERKECLLALEGALGS